MGFYAKSVGFWSSAPDPDGEASSAFSTRTNGEFSTTIDIWNIIAVVYRRFEHACI